MFSHLRHKVYLRRYGRPTCAAFFTCSSICRIQAWQILFCIDKARKRSLIHWSCIEQRVGWKCYWFDFAWEFCWNFCQIFFFFFYKRCICCFSQLSHRRFSPVQFDCVLRAVQCVLCALCANKQVHGFCMFARARTMGPWPYIKIKTHDSRDLIALWNLASADLCQPTVVATSVKLVIRLSYTFTRLALTHNLVIQLVSKFQQQQNWTRAS